MPASGHVFYMLQRCGEMRSSDPEGDAAGALPRMQVTPYPKKAGTAEEGARSPIKARLRKKDPPMSLFGTTEARDDRERTKTLLPGHRAKASGPGWPESLSSPCHLARAKDEASTICNPPRSDDGQPSTIATTRSIRSGDQAASPDQMCDTLYMILLPQRRSSRMYGMPSAAGAPTRRRTASHQVMMTRTRIVKM